MRVASGKREREHADRRELEHPPHDGECGVAEPLKKRDDRRLSLGGNASSARPKSSVKMMSGSSAPSAAAFIGFAGTRSTSHRENVGMFAAFCAAVDPALAELSRMAAIAAGSSGIRSTSGGASSAAYAAAANSVTTKNTIAPRPTRPMARALGALVMPTMRLADDERDDGHPDRIDPQRAERLDRDGELREPRRAADRDADPDAGDQCDENTRGERHALM